MSAGKADVSKKPVKKRKRVLPNSKEKSVEDGHDFQSLYKRVLVRDVRNNPLARYRLSVPSSGYLKLDMPKGRRLIRLEVSDEPSD